MYLLLMACTHINPDNSTEKEEMNQDTIAIKDTVIFLERLAVGSLNNSTIDEVSGMAASRVNPYRFWVHNDSGDKPRIFLIDSTASYQMTCTLKNAENRDWEDIAIALDPIDGKSKIYIGDIGDNSAKYKYCTIYITDEPTISQNKDITISEYQKIVYKYEDGPRDAETLMVDPITGDIIIVTKRENNVHLYQIPYPYNLTDTLVLKKVVSLPYYQIAGGDISSDGSEILLKTYQNVMYWKRKKDVSVSETLSAVPYGTTYIQEPQGEAVCWAIDGLSFYTLSEQSPFKITPILYKYFKSK